MDRGPWGALEAGTELAKDTTREEVAEFAGGNVVHDKDMGAGEAGTTLDGSTDIPRFVLSVLEVGPAVPLHDGSSPPKPDEPARHGTPTVCLIPASVGTTERAEDDVLPWLAAVVDEVEAVNASVREGGGAWE